MSPRALALEVLGKQRGRYLHGIPCGHRGEAVVQCLHPRLLPREEGLRERLLVKGQVLRHGGRHRIEPLQPPLAVVVRRQP